jgi:hypothetical protein
MLAYLVRHERSRRTYVGITRSSLDARWKTHQRNARRGQKGSLYAAIRKYGAEAFRVEAVASARTWEDLCSVERILIEQYGSYRSALGYNLTKGGDGAFGNVMSAEAKARIGAASRGRPRPPGVAAKIGAAHRGRRLPPAQRELAAKHFAEWREKNGGPANAGQPMSEAQKEKLRAAWARRREKWPNGMSPASAEGNRRGAEKRKASMTDEARAAKAAQLRSVAPKTHGAESKAKMRAAKLGKTLSPEHRRKIGDASRRMWEQRRAADDHRH